MENVACYMCPTFRLTGIMCMWSFLQLHMSVFLLFGDILLHNSIHNTNFWICHIYHYKELTKFWRHLHTCFRSFTYQSTDCCSGNQFKKWLWVWLTFNNCFRIMLNSYFTDKSHNIHRQCIYLSSHVEGSWHIHSSH